MAVTKKFSAQRIREAYQAGVRHFGENYVQEFAGKHAQLGGVTDTCFHLIGHLQSNKVRPACDLFQVIETVDSPKLLSRLNTVAAERGSEIEAMIEVKLSPEQSKTGAASNDLPDLLAAAAACPNVNLTGLMTVPPWSQNPEDSRPYFQNLAALGKQFGLAKLSMGMSNDFEVAIEEGATTIRIGTALFGPRPKPVAGSPALSA